MPIEELRSRAAALRAEALSLLAGEVGAVLRESLGGFEVAGSVALDLMVWRDIDLYARLEAGDAARLLAAIPRLTRALADERRPVSRLVFRDEHVERDPAFPDLPGLYLGIHTSDGWKIDLWAWDTVRYPVQQGRHHALSAALAGADRDLVLRLKDALHTRPDYRSTDVYDFVLAGAGESLDDFERYRG